MALRGRRSLLASRTTEVSDVYLSEIPSQSSFAGFVDSPEARRTFTVDLLADTTYSRVLDSSMTTIDVK